MIPRANPQPIAELDAGLGRRLDVDGYLVLDGLMGEPWRKRVADRFDQLVRLEGAEAGREVGHAETDTRGLANLVDKGEVFDGIWQHPLVLAAARHVLRRPFTLSSLNGREPLRGAGHQGLHADWGPRQHDEPFHVLNSLWVIDGFTPDNGSTRVVPGSHLVAGTVAEHVADPGAVHPREIVPLCTPGSVVIFNAHAWHGGRKNLSGARRRVVNAYFTAAEHPQQTDQRAHVGPATLARLSPAARALLRIS